MRNKKTKVSIIIVNYKVEKELLDCVYSIVKSSPKIIYEIIVVDNDEENKVETLLKTKFSKVKYVKSKSNLGYGGGNNLGARYAQGEYLFFLNPDTKVLHRALDNLYTFLSKRSNVGMISPVFLNDNLTPFKSQGSKELTPKAILFSQSFIRKIFTNKNIYNQYTLADWSIETPLSVDAIPGAAIMISTNLFRKIGGFDKNFFLYFEENDISKRVKDLGYKLFIVPSAKIIHLVGRSTNNLKNTENIYSKSRYLYLRKHYGLLNAVFTQVIVSLNKTSILMLLILALSFSLRFLNLENDMPFIGDQGWFYLSARDALVKGQIPLVGIASSHPWLHQGPLWTYMLVGVFWLFGFSPLNGAYLTIALGIISVLAIYIVGSKMFSKRVGLISALLYSTSPLTILYARTPYHTSPIPLFTLLYVFALYKFIKGNRMFLPLSILFLSILYNFELATTILGFILFIVLAYGIWKKTDWTKKIFNKKILVYSILAFMIPMMPIIIYDFNNNFSQTLRFVIWIAYRILMFFGFPGVHGNGIMISPVSMISFSFQFYQSLIFAASGIVALVILIFSFSLLFSSVYNLLRRKTGDAGLTMLSLWISIPLLGYFINKTSSEAYLPIFFPAFICLIAFAFDKTLKIKTLFIPIILLILLIAFINSYYVVLSEYSPKGFSFAKRVLISKEIIRRANGRSYNIVGVGDGSKFESFTMNYEYLTWWLGHAPVKSSQKLKFIILENNKGVFLMNNE